MNPQLASIDQIKNTILDLALRFGPKLLVAILILAVGFAASRWVSRWCLRGLSHVELEPPVRTLLARVAWILTLSLFVILALENLGVELLPLIAGLGVAGAGIALATQGVLSNVVAGLSIIFTKPFRVGEYISIVGEDGVVTAITLFNTTLTHVDHSRVVIPNRKIVGEILHNSATSGSSISPWGWPMTRTWTLPWPPSAQCSPPIRESSRIPRGLFSQSSSEIGQ